MSVVSNCRKAISLGLAASVVFSVGAVLGRTGAVSADESPVRPRIPVILDTDIGTDIDDAYALALCVASPELDLLGVTTVNGDTHTRAAIACRFLAAVGKGDVPVAAGRRTDQKEYGQFQYGKGDVGKRPVAETAVDFLYAQLKARPGEITLLTIGDLTNIADLITAHPDCKPWIKRVVSMGGAVRVGYNHRPPVEVEWNIKQDIKSAQIVFASGVPLVLAPLDATTHLKLDEPLRQRLFSADRPLTQQLLALSRLWEGKDPVLYDPVAVALVFEPRFSKLEELRIEVDDQGFTREVPGRPNARVAVSTARDEFLNWYIRRVTEAGK
jgi:inosine-uridine nucleoside N-ribohydrolase